MKKTAAKSIQIPPQQPLPTDPVCPIVGIGTSAGGLEALELFFTNVPLGSGLAFVIVQHLDPNHKGMLVELLQRVTKLPVAQITDRMRVQPEHVYVIPPNQDLSILHGVLQLLEPVAPRGMRLPIDSFLRSLADDQQERAVGVILSGMGSDGTLGLRSIKEKAGAVFVQTPETAKFDGMPRSAITAGLADVVAPPNELAGKIISYLNHVPPVSKRSELDLTDSDQSGLEKVILILRSETGHDFTNYKKSTLYRRIERRMSLHQLISIMDYVHFMRENRQEAELLFKELLIGVTSFFRDPGVWEQLKSKVIPRLLDAHPDGASFRAWTPACSTGEEAYSLAIIFQEVLEELNPSAHYTLQIFATDLDRQAIEVARVGAYLSNIAADVGEARLRRFFFQDVYGYRINKDIREMLIIAPQNLVMDPPFSRLDILTCRNLLIYLDQNLQKKLLPLFHYCLNPGGILVLGSSETAGPSNDLFVALSGKTRIYQRQDIALRTEPVDLPSTFLRVREGRKPPKNQEPGAKMPTTNLNMLIENLLLQNYSPAAVLTTEKGDILYFSGKTGKYLEPASGKANMNIFAMAREGLGSALLEAFARAIRDKVVIRLPGIKVGASGGTQYVDLSVQPVDGPEAQGRLLLVVFSDVSIGSIAIGPHETGTGSLKSARLAGTILELQQSQAELQTTREEMQTSQEELKSFNEELQSANEELQSMNEELTTSREEMQSMNEELQTVNHEQQAKVDELTRASDDMNNLLERTNIATLFLDADLNVRRFTTQTARVFKLIPGDAGRPITDLVSELDYPELAEDAREVLKSLSVCERQVSAKGGRWFNVRIMPYRTRNNRIDGLLITFVDSTVSKNLEGTLREALEVLQIRFDDQSEESEAVKKLNSALKKAQVVLEKSLSPQKDDPRETRHR